MPGLGRSPGEEKGYPLQCSGLENSMDCTVHEVAESDTTERLSLSIFIMTHYLCSPPAPSACLLLSGRDPNTGQILLTASSKCLMWPERTGHGALPRSPHSRHQPHL